MKATTFLLIVLSIGLVTTNPTPNLQDCIKSISTDLSPGGRTILERVTREGSEAEVALSNSKFISQPQGGRQLYTREPTVHDVSTSSSFGQLFEGELRSRPISIIYNSGQTVAVSINETKDTLKVISDIEKNRAPEATDIPVELLKTPEGNKVEIVKDKDGKIHNVFEQEKCAAYSVREGKKYCESWGTGSGSSGTTRVCLKWGTMYRGSQCLKMKTTYFKRRRRVVERTRVLNPEYEKHNSHIVELRQSLTTLESKVTELEEQKNQKIEAARRVQRTALDQKLGNIKNELQTLVTEKQEEIDDNMDWLEETLHTEDNGYQKQLKEALTKWKSDFLLKKNDHEELYRQRQALWNQRWTKAHRAYGAKGEEAKTLFQEKWKIMHEHYDQEMKKAGDEWAEKWKKLHAAYQQKMADEKVNRHDVPIKNLMDKYTKINDDDNIQFRRSYATKIEKLKNDDIVNGLSPADRRRKELMNSHQQSLEDHNEKYRVQWLQYLRDHDANLDKQRQVKETLSKEAQRELALKLNEMKGKFETQVEKLDAQHIADLKAKDDAKKARAAALLEDYKNKFALAYADWKTKWEDVNNIGPRLETSLQEWRAKNQVNEAQYQADKEKAEAAFKEDWKKIHDYYKKTNEDAYNEWLKGWNKLHAAYEEMKAAKDDTEKARLKAHLDKLRAAEEKNISDLDSYKIKKSEIEAEKATLREAYRKEAMEKFAQFKAELELMGKKSYEECTKEELLHRQDLQLKIKKYEDAIKLSETSFKNAEQLKTGIEELEAAHLKQREADKAEFQIKITKLVQDYAAQHKAEYEKFKLDLQRKNDNFPISQQAVEFQFSQTVRLHNVEFKEQEDNVKAEYEKQQEERKKEREAKIAALELKFKEESEARKAKFMKEAEDLELKKLQDLTEKEKERKAEIAAKTALLEQEKQKAADLLANIKKMKLELEDSKENYTAQIAKDRNDYSSTVNRMQEEYLIQNRKDFAEFEVQLMKKRAGLPISQEAIKQAYFQHVEDVDQDYKNKRQQAVINFNAKLEDDKNNHDKEIKEIEESKRQKMEENKKEFEAELAKFRAMKQSELTENEKKLMADLQAKVDQINKEIAQHNNIQDSLSGLQNSINATDVKYHNEKTVIQHEYSVKTTAIKDAYYKEHQAAFEEFQKQLKAQTETPITFEMAKSAFVDTSQSHDLTLKANIELAEKEAEAKKAALKLKHEQEIAKMKEDFTNEAQLKLANFKTMLAQMGQKKTEDCTKEELAHKAELEKRVAEYNLAIQQGNAAAADAANNKKAIELATQEYNDKKAAKLAEFKTTITRLTVEYKAKHTAEYAQFEEDLKKKYAGIPINDEVAMAEFAKHLKDTKSGFEKDAAIAKALYEQETKAALDNFEAQKLIHQKALEDDKQKREEWFNDKKGQLEKALELAKKENDEKYKQERETLNLAKQKVEDDFAKELAIKKAQLEATRKPDDPQDDERYKKDLADLEAKHIAAVEFEKKKLADAKKELEDDYIKLQSAMNTEHLKTLTTHQNNWEQYMESMKIALKKAQDKFNGDAKRDHELLLNNHNTKLAELEQLEKDREAKISEASKQAADQLKDDITKGKEKRDAEYELELQEILKKYEQFVTSNGPKTTPEYKAYMVKWEEQNAIFKKNFEDAKKHYEEVWATMQKELAETYQSDKKEWEADWLKEHTELNQKMEDAQQLWVKMWESNHAQLTAEFKKIQEKVQGEYEKKKQEILDHYDNVIKDMEVKKTSINKVELDALNRTIERTNKTSQMLIAGYTTSIEDIKKELAQLTSTQAAGQVTEYVVQDVPVSKMTIKSYTTCLERIYGYDRNIKEYKCLSRDQNNVFDFCLKYKPDPNGGTPTCSDTTKVYSVDVCEKWSIDQEKKEVHCALRKSTYPKYLCKGPFQSGGTNYCEERVIYRPRFYCKEMVVLDGHRVCKERAEFFGKSQYVFRCMETGKIIQNLSTSGSSTGTAVTNEGEECKTCLKFDKVLASGVEQLKLRDVTDAEDVKKVVLPEEVKGRRLGLMSAKEGILEGLMNDPQFPARDKRVLQECLLI